MDNISDYFRMHWKPLTSQPQYPTIRYGMTSDGTAKATEFVPLPELEEFINKILKDLGHGRSEE